MNVNGQYIIFIKFNNLAAILNILAYFRQPHLEMSVYLICYAHTHYENIKKDVRDSSKYLEEMTPVQHELLLPLLTELEIIMWFDRKVKEYYYYLWCYCAARNNAI